MSYVESIKDLDDNLLTIRDAAATNLLGDTDISDVGDSVTDAIVNLDNKVIDLDSEMSDSSANAVSNNVIKAYVDNKTFDVDGILDDQSANPVQNKVVTNALYKGSTVALSLLASDWEEDVDGDNNTIYVQTVTNSDIQNIDYYPPCVASTGDVKTDDASKTALSLISGGTTSAGSVTFWCYDGAPSIDLDIYMAGVYKPVKIVDFATGTDAEIIAMIKAAHNNEIDISDFWNIGDTRSIELGSYTDCVGTTYESKTVSIMITSFESYNGADNVLQFDCALSDRSGLFSLSSVSYGNGFCTCPIYTTTISNVLAALPSYISDNLTSFNLLYGVVDGVNSGHIATASGAKLAVRSAYEIFGNSSWGTQEGSDQIEYFKTSANRVSFFSSGATMLRTFKDKNASYVHTIDPSYPDNYTRHHLSYYHPYGDSPYFAFFGLL